MPKYNMYADVNPNGEDADTRLEIGWRPAAMGGEVRLGVTRIAEGAAAYRTREYFGATETEPAKPVWQGQFIELDRTRINELIRRLREARDRAFGSDE